MLMPITEPAVGYGLGAGMVFIRHNESPPGARPIRPTMAAVGGAATENGTWAGFGGHMGVWKGGRLETLAGAFYGSINLDYYGASPDSVFAEHPIEYNLEPLGGLLEARYRLGESRAMAGLGLVYAATAVSFASEALPEEIADAELDSTLSGLRPSLSWDSRNNIFTPTAGLYAKVTGYVFTEALGSDFDFQLLSLDTIFHHPLSPRLFGGVRANVQASYDDVPFYAKPFVDLRGAAIRRYVGDEVAQTEVEVRWQAWKRWSLVGFAGAGVTRSEGLGSSRDESVFTGGGGFRYEIARRYGLHMGLDLATGPHETAVYVVFGSAWFSP